MRRPSPDLERVVEASLPHRGLAFRAIGYHDHAQNREHLLLSLGDLEGGDVPVGVHTECLAGDVFRSRLCDCHAWLDQTLEDISRAGWGALVYVRRKESDDRLHHGPDLGALRIAAEILADQGLGKVRLMTPVPGLRAELERAGIKVTAESGTASPMHWRREPAR